MGTKNFSNANDLITFSRASAGTALRKIAYGSELVTNGTFDSDVSGWTDVSLPSVWNASGYLDYTATAAGQGSYRAITTVSGRVYKATADLVSSTASGNFRVGNGSTPDAGLVTAVISSGSSAEILFVAQSESSYVYLRSGAAGDFSWDNISVKEVLFDDASGDLTLFNHPAGIPRIEYDADGNVLGLLVEEARTNLSPNSNFNTGWTSSNSSLETDAAVSPDGAVNAVKLKVTTSSTHHSIYESVAGGTYAVSVFAKAGEYAGIQITGVQTTNDHACFNLVDGTAYHTGTNASNAAIEDVGNGWYRCSAVIPVTIGNLYIAVTDGVSTAWLPTFAGANATDGIYIYGAQIEAGAFPTSYIPTAGATATRSADVASIPVADFGYNQSEGSVVVEGTQYESSNSISRFVELYGGGTGSGGYLSLGVYQDSSWIETYNGDVLNLYDVKVSGERQKMASGFDSSGNTFCGDGNILGTPSTSSLVNPSSVSLLYVGVHWAGIQQLNGHIKSIKYFPRKLTNAQLQELTT